MTLGRIFDKEDGYYKQLGRIEEIDICNNDCRFNLHIMFDFGGSAQGVSWILDDPIKTKEDKKFITRLGSEYGTELIRRLMRAFCVDKLQQIKNKTAYALYKKDDFQEYIIGIEVPESIQNKCQTHFQQIVPEKLIKEIEEIHKVESGQLPFKKFEWI